MRVTIMCYLLRADSQVQHIVYIRIRGNIFGKNKIIRVERMCTNCNISTVTVITMIINIQAIILLRFITICDWTII